MDNVTLSLEAVKHAHRSAGPDPSAPDREPASPGANSFPPHKGGTGQGTNLRLVSAAELLAEESEPLRWIWEPFLPEGTLALLAAFMKVGKSTFAYALAVAVAQGRDFLGYQTTSGGVAILAVEEHPRDVLRRLRRFGLRDTDALWVHRGELRNFPETIAKLETSIRAERIKLVIVDTVARFWNLNDENNNAEMERQVSPLLDLAHRTGAVVLLVHHERKTGGEGGRGIRGGSALLGLVDQAFTLTRPAGPATPQRVLEAVGRYSETTPSRTTFKLDGNVYERLPTPGREAAREAVGAALSIVLQSTACLAGKTGYTKKVVKQALVDLGSQVVREGEGVKGDPYGYRRASPDSILSLSTPIGEGTNSPNGPLQERLAAQSAELNRSPPGTREGKSRRHGLYFALVPDLEDEPPAGANSE